MQTIDKNSENTEVQRAKLYELGQLLVELRKAERTGGIEIVFNPEKDLGITAYYCDRKPWKAGKTKVRTVKRSRR